MSEEDISSLGSMSDEDFLKQDFAPVEEVTDTEVVEEEEVTETDEEVDLDETEEETSTEEELTEESEEELTEAEETSTEPEDTNLEESNADLSDFEKKILAPFKANGRTMQVKNADEALQLMQMGANYNKKMSGLKDNLKLVKMLQNNGLTDTDKLNHLIDLSKHDKGAINKLIQDAKLDVDDLDEDGTEYAPNTYNVSDNQIALDDVLDSIQHTESYAQTIDVISNKWDDSSREALAKKPDQIAVINAHIGSGVYKQITDEVERQDMMGTLPANLSDIQAYEYVGSKLYPQTQTPESVKSNVAYEPNKHKGEDPQLKKRKKALSSPKAKKAKQVVAEVDFSKLTDEEVLAL